MDASARTAMVEHLDTRIKELTTEMRRARARGDDQAVAEHRVVREALGELRGMLVSTEPSVRAEKSLRLELTPEPSVRATGHQNPFVNREGDQLAFVRAGDRQWQTDGFVDFRQECSSDAT